MKKLTLLIIAISLLTISTVGCNAARGVGKDIESAGKHVENIGK